MLLIFPFIHHLKEICSSYKTLGIVPKTHKEQHPQLHKQFVTDESLSSSQPIQCCARTFRTKFKFLRHTKTSKHQRNTSCETCSQQCTTTGDLHQHKRLVHGLAANCEICCASFKEQHELEKHVQFAHNQSIYLCTICSFQASSINILRAHHTITHSIDGTQESISSRQCGPFKCCGKTFKNVSHYERHKTTLSHSRQSKCRICLESFSSAEALEQHREDLHFFSGSRWTCPICEQTFSSNGNRSVHLKRVHMKATSYECGKCQYIGFDKWQLSRHIKSKHTPDNALTMYSCHICHRQFRRKDKLSEHLRTHNKETVPAYKCSKCSYAAHSQHFLNRHFMCKHALKPKQYKCSSCVRMFHREDQLKKHAEVHKKNGSEYHYCSVCNITFSSAERLEAHKPAHIPCQVCGVVIGGRRAREKHRRSHLNLSREIMCNKKLSSNNSM